MMPAHHEPTAATKPTTTTDAATHLARLERELTRLRFMVAGLALGLVTLVTVGAVRPPVASEVLRAERIEIVEPDGTLAFVLASSARPQAATMDGVTILEGQEEERRSPSFIFFDGKGDEVGGMLFSNEVRDDGFSAMRHFSLDGFKQDQTVVLHHYQDARGTRAGLSVSDRPEQSMVEGFRSLGLEIPVTRERLQEAIMALPEGERQERLGAVFGGAPRAFVGRARDGSAALVLSDGLGRTRIHLGVPHEGEPFLRILDEEGTPVLSWPEP